MSHQEPPPPSALPVFIRRGDATSELNQLISQLGSDPEAAGLRKFFYVARADQTVVMLSGREVPLGKALRGRKGWEEPVEGD
jgi:hypothetical protein